MLYGTSDRTWGQNLTAEYYPTLSGSTRENANVVLILTLLGKLSDLITAYLGKDEDFDEQNVKRNFILIHELLDECVDFGWPQLTELSVLQQ